MCIANYTLGIVSEVGMGTHFEWPMYDVRKIGKYFNVKKKNEQGVVCNWNNDSGREHRSQGDICRRLSGQCFTTKLKH